MQKDLMGLKCSLLKAKHLHAQAKESKEQLQVSILNSKNILTNSRYMLQKVSPHYPIK